MLSRRGEMYFCTFCTTTVAVLSTFLLFQNSSGKSNHKFLWSERSGMKKCIQSGSFWRQPTRLEGNTRAKFFCGRDPKSGSFKETYLFWLKMAVG